MFFLLLKNYRSFKRQLNRLLKLVFFGFSFLDLLCTASGIILFFHSAESALFGFLSGKRNSEVGKFIHAVMDMHGSTGNGESVQKHQEYGDELPHPTKLKKFRDFKGF
jgi:hypothetical protein